MYKVMFQRRQFKKRTGKHATVIQKMWRAYYCRVYTMVDVYAALDRKKLDKEKKKFEQIQYRKKKQETRELNRHAIKVQKVYRGRLAVLRVSKIKAEKAKEEKARKRAEAQMKKDF